MGANRSIFELVSALATEAGFDAAGIAAAPEPGSAGDYAELENFAPWVEAGRAGEMDYLKREDDAGRMVRSSLRIALPWARSVIVCAANYNAAAPRSIDASKEGAGWIARYAWTGQAPVVEGGAASGNGAGGLRPSDYHNVLLKRLRDVESRLHENVAALGGGDFESRCYVDTGPVVERVYAKYAGIGWLGKNTCILNQQLGSWLFLGVIVTSIDVEEDAYRSANQGQQSAIIVPDRCGTCTRCIDACPTDALTAPYQMDASLCISYLTIEKRGEIAEPLRAKMGRQVFGCDICQDVCPWNRKAPISTDQSLTVRAELVNPALEWLADLDQESFGRMFFGSPVKRARFEGLRRNVAIAMGNSGLSRYVPRLEQWAGSDDAVLAEAAVWAIERIGNAGEAAEASG